MADELTPITNPEPDPEPEREAVAVLQASNELRDAEFMRLFLHGKPGVQYNQVAAARKAGFGANSTDEVVRVMASRVLHQPRNMLRIRRMLDRWQLSTERQVEEASRMAFAKMVDYATWDERGVHIKASNELDEDQHSAVATVTEHTAPDGAKTVEVKLVDKIRAGELLARLRKLIGPGPEERLAEGANFTFTINVNDRSQTLHVHTNGGPATNGDAPQLPPTSGEGA